MPRRTPTRREPLQTVLPWPGSDEVCPRCRGARQVYHHTARYGVAILGGKRIPCPACEGVGAVRTPRLDDPPAEAG
jgi:hypothetical protein